MALLALLVVAATACGGQEDAASSDGTWVGAITTEGNVTTVVNESGSVWGGTATLVEEASIGVESGPEEYMLGRVMGLAASDERIYVLDSTVPVIRVFDIRGHHVADIGREGEGPGEFHNPNGLAIASDGRIFVRSVSRIAVFSPDGAPVAHWPQEGGVILPMRVGEDGTLYTAASRFRLGYQPIAKDGSKGDFIPEPDIQLVTERVIVGMNIESVGAALSPRGSWTMAPFEAMVAGVPVEYRFEIRYLNGEITVVRRLSEPLPIGGAEIDWYRRAIGVLQRDSDLGVAALPPELPPVKPAFEQISTDMENRIWLRRIVATEDHRPECSDVPQSAEEVRTHPCFEQVWGLDGFEESGRFLGTIKLPPEVRFSYAVEPFLWGNQMLAVAEDEGGTIMVKRYRLLLPGEEQ